MSDKRECPDCGAIGDHDHPTTGVRSCDECAYCAGKAGFKRVDA